MVDSSAERLAGSYFPDLMPRNEIWLIVPFQRSLNKMREGRVVSKKIVPNKPVKHEGKNFGKASVREIPKLTCGREFVRGACFAFILYMSTGDVVLNEDVCCTPSLV
jgi:hypothetical protein